MVTSNSTMTPLGDVSRACADTSLAGRSGRQRTSRDDRRTRHRRGRLVRQAPPEESAPPSRPAAPTPTSAGLRRVLAPLLRTSGLGSSVSAEVVDLATGTTLLSVSPQRPAVPASSAKLLTGAAALSLLGPSQRLATTVVDGAGTD